MTTSPLLSLSLVLPLSLAAASCGGPQDGGQTMSPTPSATPAQTGSAAIGPGPSSAPSAQPPAANAGEDTKWITPGPAFVTSTLFADQKLDEIAKKLEGTWVVSGDAGKEAWEVKGNVVTVVKNGEAHPHGLLVTSPCTLEKKRKDGMSITSHFVVDGDMLYTGLDDFGIKLKDGTIIACVLNGVYVLKKNKCDKHQFLLSEWRGEPAKCSMTKDVFEASDAPGHKLALHGSVLMTNEPAQMKAEKVADLAAAKAKIAK